MEISACQSTHRIALVSGGLSLGGSTTFLINFAGELVRRGIPVEVISFERENPMTSDFQRQNIPVLCLDQRRMIFEDRLKIILENLVRFGPTVTVSVLGSLSFEVLRYLPKGVFRIGMGQSDDPIVYDMMRHYTPWMDVTAMVSQTMKLKAAAMPEFAELPLAYVPYGVPMPSAASLPLRYGSALQRILYLGRLGREQKRVHLFPQILSRLCASGMPFHWTIAGDGEERDFLKANLKPIALNQTVSFAGPVSYADVPSVLKQHDIFLLASDYEGLPLSLLEAMGHGLVPVVSDLPSGIPEVVDENTGRLVPSDNIAGYADAIIALHNNRDEMWRLSRNARERVHRDFCVSAMTDRWLKVFPKQVKTDIVWPQRWQINPPLGARNSFYFWPLVRLLRRLTKRLSG